MQLISIFKRRAISYFKKGRYIFRSIIRPSVVRVGGQKLNVNSAPISEGMRERFYRGAYEQCELRILRATLSESDRLIEVGAGVGFLSIVAAKILGEKSVLAIEANPDLVPVIKRNLALNNVGSVRVENCVLAAEPNGEEVEFFCMPDFWSSGLDPRLRLRALHVAKVRQRAVSSVLREFKPSYAVIDVEGAEIDLAPLICLPPIEKLLVEFHPVKTGQKAVDDTIFKLAQLGYAIDHGFDCKDVRLFKKIDMCRHGASTGGQQ